MNPLLYLVLSVNLFSSSVATINSTPNDAQGIFTLVAKYDRQYGERP